MHGAAPEDLPARRNPGEDADLLSALGRGHWKADGKMLILYPHVYGRLKRLAAGGHAGRTFGFERPLQTEGPALLKKVTDLATRAKHSFVVADTRMPLDVLTRYALIICPTLEVLSAQAMEKLASYVEAGGFLAVGPRIPLLDETMRRNDVLARRIGGGLTGLGLELIPSGRGGVFTLPGHVSPATIEFLAFESGLARGLTADAAWADSVVHRRNGERLLLAANPNPHTLRTSFSGEAYRELVPLKQGSPTVRAGQPVALTPFEIVAWKVRPAGDAALTR